MSIFNNLMNDEAPKQGDASGTDIEEPVVKTTDVADNRSDTKYVVLDGPLSRIYTQALDVAYANESAEIDSQVIFDTVDGPNGYDIEDKSRLYVYCCDGDKLDTDGLVNSTKKLRLALDAKKYKDVVVGIECNKVNGSVALLDKYCSDLGIKVYYSRKSTVDKVIDSLRK